MVFQNLLQINALGQVIHLEYLEISAASFCGIKISYLIFLYLIRHDMSYCLFDIFTFGLNWINLILLAYIYILINQPASFAEINNISLTLLKNNIYFYHTSVIMFYVKKYLFTDYLDDIASLLSPREIVAVGGKGGRGLNLIWPIFRCIEYKTFCINLCWKLINS